MQQLPAQQINIVRKLLALQLRERIYLHLSNRLPSFANRMGNFFSNATDLPRFDALKMVEMTVSKNCVVIFSKTTCPYCSMAKEAFNSINVSYKTIELDEMENGNQVQEALREMTGGRSVPKVFVNGTCIGGGTETRKLNQEGKLLQLVQQCNITADIRT